MKCKKCKAEIPDNSMFCNKCGAKLETGQKKKTRYRSYFTFDGKKYEATGKSQKEADQKAAIMINKLENGEVGISSNMTVKAWAVEWLETYKRPVVGEGQYKNYKMHIDNAILPLIGNYTLRSVKDVHLQKVINSRVGKSKSDLSKLRITLKAIFERAYISKLIPYNPAAYLELPTCTEGTRRSITPYERQKILELAETHRSGLWIKTLLYAGLRPGETRALDWRHIDFNKRIIHVEQAMKAHTKDIGIPKTIAGIRDIPIKYELFTALSSAHGKPFDPVFTQPTTGKRHTEESMRSLWGNFKRHLDISMGASVYRNKIIVHAIAPDLVPYCLRHTYCTDLQDAGVPINVARYLMGHNDISVTAKIYTHTTEKALDDVAKRINPPLKSEDVAE